MKIFISTLILILMAFTGIGQNEEKAKELISEGVELHDMQLYDQAIKKYEEALILSPENPLALYEMAFSYNKSGQYEKAVEYGMKVLSTDNEHNLPAYMVVGNSLDDLDRNDEAVKLYEKGLKKYKTEHLLYYNYAIALYRANDLKKAEEALIAAIGIRPSHPGSHLTLAYIKADQNLRARSMLALYFFLLLENDSERATEAWKYLNGLWNKGTQADPSKPNTIEIVIVGAEKEKEMKVLDMYLSMLEAGKTLDENKSKTNEELFFEKTEGMLSMMATMKGKKNDFFWNFYAPFFTELSKEKHTEAFCYYISMASGKKEISDWLSENEEKVKLFAEWLKNK